MYPSSQKSTAVKIWEPLWAGFTPLGWISPVFAHKVPHIMTIPNERDSNTQSTAFTRIFACHFGILEALFLEIS